VDEYLDLAGLGKNEWWRYVVAILIILFTWQIIGSIPTVILIAWVLLDGNAATFVNRDATFTGVSLNISFIAFMLASWAFVVGIFLAVHFIHQRRFLTLATPAVSIRWKRLFQGFGVWFVLSILVAVTEALLHPGRYVWSLNLGDYIPFVFLAIILIPIQTSAEELFFRGYLLQAFGRRVRNIWLLSAISGVIFMLPHFLNPEAKLNLWLMGLYYFSMGAAMAYVSLRDGRLELALGMHAANNLFTALFANAVVTVMPTPSMFTVMEMDVVYSVISSLVIILVFVALFVGPLRENPPQTEPIDTVI
jgi:membrane protease YdiL (CAAX protease family)